MNIKTILAFCGVAILTVSANGNELTGCVAKQFLEYKTRGFIHCKFPQDFNSVYWYDVDNSDAKPILTYDRTTKTGEGFIRGEYDIQPNGTLIIRNVSMSHEKVFKVICFRPRELFNTYQIEVIVTVTPEQGFPRISNCSTTGELCVHQDIASGDKLTCTVHGAKPSVTLSWSVLLGNVERPLHAHATIKPSTDWNVTFHSTAVLDLANVTTCGLNLFICSSALEPIGNRRYSQVLVDMLQADVVNDKTYKDVFRERDKRVELKCSSGNTDNMYVWKKILSHSVELVSYGLDYDMIVAKRLQERYEVKTDKTLYIDSAQIEDEGKFICISSDGINHYVATMNLVVLVSPSPSYLMIEGCTTGNCMILSNVTDSLTCSVTGVRPPLNLKWSAEEERSFTITYQNQTSVENMGLYDIKSIMYFETSKIICEDTVKITCEAIGAATQLFRPLTEVRIKVVRNCTEESSELEVKSTNKRKDNWKNYFLSVMAVSFILLISIFVIVIWRIRTPTTLQPGTDTEKQSLVKTVGFKLTKINITEETRESFMEQIQTSYKETVLNSKSAYYVPNHLTVLPFQMRLGQKTTSQKMLDSFEHIFTDPELEDKNVLIEGRSGIGKTALVLHMIENWLLCKDKSPLIEYDMIIMLSLKNINDINLSSAIIKYLLPEDGGWKEETIKGICQTDKKVLAIFDDFDQYSELENSKAEVNKMLRKKIRQKWKVIVLCKPMLYDNLISNSVLKLQIKRFTSDQVDQYVNKFLSGTEDEKRENLKKIIHSDSLIENLCMTPIFLFMIASQFQKHGHRVSIDENSKILRFLVDVMSKDKNGEDILCKDRTENLCVSQIATKAVKSKSDSWINDENDEKLSRDINRFVDKGVLVYVNSKKKDEERQLRFSHDVYKYLCTAHYLINHCVVHQHEHFLQGIDIPSSSQLFIYTCGLCEDKETFTMIINHLLANQLNEWYPYHITDCIVECFNGSHQKYHVKDLLQKVCELEFIFNFKERDSTDLRNAKIYLFNTCTTYKLPIKALSIYSGIKKVTKTEITVEGCQKPLNVPDNLKTLIMADFDEKIKDTDVLHLLETICTISEIIIHSSIVPKHTTSSVFDVLREREHRRMLVIWITYKEEEVHMISYLSEVYNNWLNYSEIMAINLYRKTNEWKELCVEDRFLHEKEILKEIKDTSVGQFLNKKLTFSKEEDDAFFGKLKSDMDTLRDIIDEWHNVYGSTSQEDEKTNRKKLDKLVGVLMKKINKAKTGSEQVRSNPELQGADNEKESGNETLPTSSANKLRLFSAQLRDVMYEIQLKHPKEVD